jgi:hypothetical protein
MANRCGSSQDWVMPDIPHGIKPKGERPKRSRSGPPTIGFLKSQGIKGARVFCSAFSCGHHAVVSFELIRVADGTPFPALRFKCTKCGKRGVQAQPDWPKPSDQMPVIPQPAWAMDAAANPSK